ncbi:MAG: monovalent cation/H+ antiporter complex subunit F [Fimbriimonadales bacterium]
MLGVALFIILLATGISLYRAILGPTAHDRVLAINVVNTKTVVIIVLIGFINRRPEVFMDIAIIYAVINFVSTLAFLRYLESRSVD